MGAPDHLARGFAWIAVIIKIILGLALVSLGIYIHMGNPGVGFPENPVLFGVYMLGSLILLLGIMGFITIKTKHPCLMTLYLVASIVFLALKFYIVFVVMKHEGTKDDMYSIWSYSGENGQRLIQNTFRCCGFSEFDWSYPRPCEYAESCPDRIYALLDAYGIWIHAATFIVLILQLLNIMAVTFISAKGCKPCKKKITVTEHANDP